MDIGYKDYETIIKRGRYNRLSSNVPTPTNDDPDTDGNEDYKTYTIQAGNSLSTISKN